jgi:hypothetical protein
VIFRNLSPAIVLVALCGCATNSPVRPAHLSLPIVSSNIDAEVRLTQHQMLVSHLNSTAGGAAGLQMAASPSVAAGGFAAGAAVGLIGALVDVAIDAHRNGVAEDAAKPMREHMTDISVDDLIYSSMDGLDKTVFGEHVELARVARAEDDDKQQRQLKPGTNILVLTPSYSVSYDGATFTYVLAVRLVDRAMNQNGFVVSTPRYQQVFQYVIAQDSLPDRAKWATLSAEQWKSIFTQASTEAVAMLNYDIGAAPGAMSQKVDYGRLHVTLDRTNGDRSWVRTHFGLLSVMSTSLGAKDHS